MYLKILLSVSIVCLLAWLPASADAPDDPGVQRTEVLGFDNWPAENNPIEQGSLECPGGEVEWLNPVTPYCASSGQLLLRGVKIWGCTSGSDERFVGTAVAVVNGNLDANHTGPVWGTWIIVPSESCTLDALVMPDSYWSGTWQGQRTLECDAGPCNWVGDLKLVGKGYGGEIHGARFKGSEIVLTFTALPVPYELIPGFPYPDVPEGVISGVVTE